MSRRTVVGIVVGVMVTVGGMLVGFSVAATGFTLPSDSEIGDAAHTLVPPGATVNEVTAGRPSTFGPFVGGTAPYRVSIDATAQPGTFPERLAEAEAVAEAAGWVESGRSDRPGAVRIKYDRGALTADVSVRKPNPDPNIKRTYNFRVRVEEDKATVTLHRRIGAAIGGALALGAWVVWRRRKPGPAAEAQPVS